MRLGFYGLFPVSAQQVEVQMWRLAGSSGTGWREGDHKWRAAGGHCNDVHYWLLLLLIDWNWLTVKSSSAAYCHPCFVPEDMIGNIGDARFLWHWSWVVMNMCSSWSPICEANLANRKMQSVQSSWDLQVMHWSMSRSTDFLYMQDNRMSWQGIEWTYPWNSWMSNKNANHTVDTRNPAPVCRWCISSYNPIIYSVS